MRRVPIGSLAFALLWMWLVWTGIGLVQGVVEQNAPGYPNSGQINYYIVFPAVMTLVCAAAAAGVWKGRYLVAARTVQVLGALALLPFLLMYTGGM